MRFVTKQSTNPNKYLIFLSVIFLILFVVFLVLYLREQNKNNIREKKGIFKHRYSILNSGRNKKKKHRSCNNKHALKKPSDEMFASFQMIQEHEMPLISFVSVSHEKRCKEKIKQVFSNFEHYQIYGKRKVSNIHYYVNFYLDDLKGQYICFVKSSNIMSITFTYNLEKIISEGLFQLIIFKVWKKRNDSILPLKWEVMPTRDDFSLYGFVMNKELVKKVKYEKDIYTWFKNCYLACDLSEILWWNEIGVVIV